MKIEIQNVLGSYFGRALAILAIGHSSVLAQVPDPRLCAVQGDPVASPPFSLVDSYCVRLPSIGADGGPATITSTGQFPANANGVVDGFVIWEPVQFAVQSGQSFTYSSTLSWTSQKPNARVKEWVGNFLLNPPQAFLITDTDGASPPELTKTATSATITNRTFDFAQFPPVPIGRFHFQVSGLDPGELVTFTKNAGGGTVIVPEPSSLLIAMMGLVVFLHARRR